MPHIVIICISCCGAMRFIMQHGSARCSTGPSCSPPASPSPGHVRGTPAVAWGERVRERRRLTRLTVGHRGVRRTSPMHVGRWEPECPRPRASRAGAVRCGAGRIHHSSPTPVARRTRRGSSHAAHTHLTRTSHARCCCGVNIRFTRRALHAASSRPEILPTRDVIPITARCQMQTLISRRGPRRVSPPASFRSSSLRILATADHTTSQKNFASSQTDPDHDQRQMGELPASPQVENEGATGRNSEKTRVIRMQQRGYSAALAFRPAGSLPHWYTAGQKAGHTLGIHSSA